MMNFQDEMDIDNSAPMDIKMIGAPVHLELVLEHPPVNASSVSSEEAHQEVSGLITQVRPSSRTKTKVVPECEVKRPLGRRPEDVWNEFEVTILGPNKKMTVCKHCSKKTSHGARAYRLREHLAKCRKFLEKYGNPHAIVKEEVDLSSPSRRGRPPGAKNSKQLANACHLNTSTRKGEKCRSTTVMANEREKISKQLTRFLVSTRIPLNIVKNEEFGAFVKALRPDYALPTHEHLSGTLFQTVVSDLRTEAEENIVGEKVVLLQSGWSRNASSSSTRLISHILQNGNKKFFLNTVEVPLLESDENCTLVLKDAVSVSENEYNCKVVGIFTDYITNNFESIRSTLEEAIPYVHVLVSQVHLIMYVAQTFVDYDVMDKILKIYQYFRSYDYQCDKMREDIMNCPQTRWENDHKALVAFVRDREKYVEILTDSQYQTASRIQLNEPVIQIPRKWNSVQEADFLEILNDMELYKKAELMINALSPIQIALDNMLKDAGSSLADGVSCWLSLTKNSTFSEYQFQRILEYKNIAVTPSSLASYMLHPKYKGMLLSEDEMETGRSYIITVNFEYLDPAIAFIQSDCSVYPKSLMTEVICKTMDPIRWWREQLRNTKLPSGFVQFTLSLLALPANVYSWERCIAS